MNAAARTPVASPRVAASVVIALLLLLLRGARHAPAAEVAESGPPAKSSSAGGAATADNLDGTPEPSRAELFKQIEAGLKRTGTQKDGVLTITIPRDDLLVTVENQDVPTAAGIESQFRFYQCPCGGKIVVIGQFVTADYEANDVVDALREGHLVVSSVGPFLAYEQPRLTLVRFQGEAKADEMAKTISKALEWTGDQRGKPQKPRE